MKSIDSKRALQSAVKRTARLVDQVRPPESGVAVLEYHRVGSGADAELDVDTSTFRSHVEHLAEHSDVTSLSEAVIDLRTVPPLEQNRVAITFDDGTIDIHENAFPVLVEHSLPALIYLATDFVDQQRSFPHAGHPLTWAALREMTDSGLIEVGSHTHTHAVVDKLNSQDLRHELQRSKERIEHELQQPVRHFAYPKGVRATGSLENVVVEEFETAAIAGSRINPFMQTNLHRLDRVPIQRSDDWPAFLAKIDGGMRLEGHLRGSLNKVRYARRTN